MSENPKPPAETPSLRNRALAIGGVLAAAIGGGLALPGRTATRDGMPEAAPGALVVPDHQPALPATPEEHQHQAAGHEHNSASVEPGVQNVDVISQPAQPSRPTTGPGRSKSPHHKRNARKHKLDHKRGPDHIGVPSPEPGKLPLIQVPQEIPPAPSSLLNMHPENLTVPSAVSKIMRDNVVKMSPIGCSGWLIRDTSQQPIGMVTAQHCDLQPSEGHRTVDANGNTTINFDQPVTAATGDIEGSLTTVGDISQFLLDAPADMTKDQALADFWGHSMEDVVANYPQMSPDQIATLKTGDVIYNSGWPQAQANNSGPEKRQEFAMSVLGMETVTTTQGYTLKVLTAAVPESKDGAECSFGDSGSVGFTVGPDGKVGIIGGLSGFNDFGLVGNKNPQTVAQVKAYYEYTFGVSLDGYASICSFAYEPPSPDNGGVLARVLTPESIGTGSLGEFEQQYYDNFVNSPTFVKRIINGKVQINGLKSSYVVDSPLVVYDPGDDMTILGWYSPKGGLFFQPFKSDELPSIAVYSPDGQNQPSIMSFNGLATVNSDGTAYVNAQGKQFGQLETTSTVDGPAVDGLAVEGGMPTLEPFKSVEAESQDMATAQAQFDDPSFNRIRADGVAIIRPNAGPTVWAKDPYIYYNPDDGNTVVSYADPGRSGLTSYVYGPLTATLEFVGDSTAVPTLGQIDGQVTYKPAADLQHNGYFVDEQGNTIGEQLVTEPQSQGTGYVLKYVDGQLTFQPAPPAAG